MSRTSEVIKNKNKVEKARKARRKNEMLTLRNKSAFRAKLHDELNHVYVLLESGTVNAVVITVPEKILSEFNASLYSEDLAGYIVEQVEGVPNQFYLRSKIIDLG